MYIKSMVLEGFKSYGKRIEINDFNKEFNAITGFNGSGKSNILDAICFVLGISNLGQVIHYFLYIFNIILQLQKSEYFYFLKQFSLIE